VADDIVTRLRDGGHDHAYDSFCDVCTSPHVLAREAADEIVRLRALIVEWYDAHQVPDDQARNIDAAIALVAEARRG
jgi:hypothetical protein